MLQMNYSGPIVEIHQRWCVLFEDEVVTRRETPEGGNNRQRGLRLDRVNRAVSGQPNFDDDWNGYRRPRDKLRRTVMAAILDLWPAPGPPAWMKFTAIVEDVNERLVKGGYWPQPVHSSTIKRALARLSDRYKPADNKVRKERIPVRK
jgi:hypothetical protein